MSNALGTILYIMWYELLSNFTLSKYFTNVQIYIQAKEKETDFALSIEDLKKETENLSNKLRAKDEDISQYFILFSLFIFCISS
jgi:hypothetical protein